MTSGRFITLQFNSHTQQYWATQVGPHDFLSVEKRGRIYREGCEEEGNDYNQNNLIGIIKDLMNVVRNYIGLVK